MNSKILIPVLVALALPAFAREAYNTYPVSEPCNPMYLKGMADKPWWDDAWKFRLPVVVSEMSTNEVAAYVADFEVDLGQPGMADSVRVVTDYEEKVSCWVEDIGGSKVRVQFKTALNAAENKCFFIYFGNPEAKKCVPADEVAGCEHDGFITVRNAVLTLDFITDTTQADALRRFKINGSWADNELALQPSRVADSALAVFPRHASGLYTNTVTLAVSTPFKKQVKVENDVFTALYTLYADASRLDYSYVAKDPKVRPFDHLHTSWASGGGMAWDDLLYPSLIGSINTDRAALDYRRDSGEPIRHSDLGDWSGEGWFAFYDRKTSTSVGQFYSPADVTAVRVGEHSGGANCHSLTIALRPGDAKRPQGEIRGAAFGTLARADIIRNDYRVWANPPRVIAGTGEPWRRIERRRPDMAHDFCTFQQLGPDSRTIKGRVDGLPEKTAKNIAAYLRRDGFNGAHFVGEAGRWWNWAPSRAVFDEICAAATNKTYGGNGKAPCTWEESVNGSRNFKAFLDALHAEGISGYQWGGCLYGSDALFTQDRARELDIETMALANVRIGMDATWCGIQGHEGPMMMEADWSRVGGKFWRYKDDRDRDHFFRLQDIRVEHARRFCETVRKAGGKSLNWGCDLGHLANDQFSLENAGDFDVIIQELMIGHLLDRNERNRFGVARMRAMLNNEPHTVWNHFWARTAGDDYRIGNCDLPFIYGVNGFNQEGDDYRQVDPEIVTKGTDFYRFAYNTGLAKVSPKFIPVRFFNVFRDQNDHRADACNDRCHCRMRSLAGDFSDTDGAAASWTTARAIHGDLTLNRFLTLENLRHYPMLALPHNFCLTEEQFGVVKRYVEEGGVCYAEGELFPFAKFFTDGAENTGDPKWGFTRKAFGKGKLLYTPRQLSLKYDSLEPGGAVRAFVVAEMGRPEPLVFERAFARYVDGMVRTDGVNYMFGTFALNMPGGTAAVVRATFNLPLEKGRKYFALDMRSGRRVPFDGTLEFMQRPRAVTHWLIGDEAFTAVPAHTVCRAPDYGAIRAPKLSEGAKKNLAAREELGDFTKPLAVLLFQEPADPTSVGTENLTIARGAFAQVLFSRANYDKSVFSEAVGSASLVHFKEVKADILEKVFAESSDALKTLLRRGGGILFDRSPTTPAAKRFLKEVDVYDPCEARVAGGDYWGQADFDALGKDHVLYTKPWNIYQPWVGHRMQAAACYAKWDAERQIAPFVVSDRDSPVKGRKHAMCVCQDKVLGSGRVVFQENHGAFTAWYEGVTYGENLFSYAIGMDLKEHKRKVQLLRGGFGTPVKFPEIIRNKL